MHSQPDLINILEDKLAVISGCVDILVGDRGLPVWQGREDTLSLAGRR